MLAKCLIDVTRAIVGAPRDQCDGGSRYRCDDVCAKPMCGDRVRVELGRSASSAVRTKLKSMIRRAAAWSTWDRISERSSNS
jgi:hypothetical protein